MGTHLLIKNRSVWILESNFLRGIAVDEFGIASESAHVPIGGRFKKAHFGELLVYFPTVDLPHHFVAFFGEDIFLEGKEFAFQRRYFFVVEVWVVESGIFFLPGNEDFSLLLALFLVSVEVFV